MCDKSIKDKQAEYKEAAGGNGKRSVKVLNSWYTKERPSTLILNSRTMRQKPSSKAALLSCTSLAMVPSERDILNAFCTSATHESGNCQTVLF